MENASKALLIAGAILVVIVLISVGMLIVNSTQDITDQAGDLTTTQATQAFNTQFTKYNGNQKGSAVKALYEAVRASNATATSRGGHEVKWNGQATGSATDTAIASVKNSAKYSIVCSYDSDGYVDNIKVTGDGIETPDDDTP